MHIDIAGGRVDIYVLRTLATFASVFMGNTLEGGSLLAIFNLAHIAEEYYTKRALGDVKALKESNPEVALVLDAFDSAISHHFSSMAAKRVLAHDLEVDSYILVRPGEAVPVDGDSVPGGARNLDGMLIMLGNQ
jgi:cation transport ATPase